MNNLSYTINLPKTNFPMRADLTKKEHKILKRWQEEKLYKIIRKSRKHHKIFNLHDGPPYANGNIHIGHAVNKILKDIIIKFKILSDYDTHYIPGWDCHGLPIEQKIEEHNTKLVNIKNMNYPNILKFINLCRNYAMHEVLNQKKDFMRLGIFADWENSYLTMDYKNQAIIIRTIGILANKGYLYLEDRPVYWCLKCISSLADAEIEFKINYTKSIYVLFDINKNTYYYKLFSGLKNYPMKLVIWTTTPWTLPANQAVAVNHKYWYTIIATKNQYLVLEQTLTTNIINLLNINYWEYIGVVKGNILEHIEYYHPFNSTKLLRLILSDHVTNQQGTGLVHIAPDHGIEDFNIGKTYNLKTINIINSYGYYIKSKVHPILQGINLMEAEIPIINWLQLHNNLMLIKKIEHSYPYCWRHHYPVIYRSTPQWFINMEHNNLRNKCLKNINLVNWIPNKSKKRIASMLKLRPDWCISRQRLWGVPLPLIFDKNTNLVHPDIEQITNILAQLVEKEGVKVWWKIKLDYLLKNTKTKKEVSFYKKSNDIIDVWFDSGCSFLFVSNNNYSNYESMDLYIEGNDQHRGWFMSSLIISTILINRPPYKSVITHGFVVDDKGKKFSKSEYNNVLPQEIIDRFGVDILRLWVASNNYINEMNLSYKKIEQISDGYRRIRNTARYLLANLFDFNPLNDLVDYTKLLQIDKWALAQGFRIQRSIISCYERYHFYEVINKILNFCSITMGSVYLEIIKDRQYTMPAKSLGRRSCQTSIFYLLEALVKWIAPILPFTADEIWQYIPNNGNKMLFTEVWCNKLQDFENKKDIINEDIWIKLFALKSKINKLIEKLKITKLISNSLELGITLNLTNINFKQYLKILECELHYLLLVSKVYISNNINTIHNDWKKLTVVDYLDVKISIYKIEQSKCARCWHYVNNLGTNAICNRCINNMTSEEGEYRQYF